MSHYEPVKKLRLQSDERICTVSLSELVERIAEVSNRFTSEEQSNVIAEMIAKAESMGVASHGLHYFVYYILPLLEQGEIRNPEFEIRGNAVYSDSQGGVGFLNVRTCLAKASRIAASLGISMAIFKNPGKVGALRIYCEEITKKGQLIMMFKNTAATVGLAEMREPHIGTNPICIGLPDTDFIYDASTATVATNKLRVFQKKGRKFEHKVGINKDSELSSDPDEILDEGGLLLPSGFESFWFKSFFLGVAIECIAAAAGGKTSSRVGRHKGRRPYSEEGMVAFIIDKKVFPDYKNYLEESKLLFSELKQYGLRIPGSYKKDMKFITVLKEDWDELGKQ